MKKNTLNRLSQYRIVALTFLCVNTGQVSYGKATSFRSNLPILSTVVDEIPTITSGGITHFCNGSSLLLTSSLALTYQWYRDETLVVGAVGQTFLATISGIYKVHVTYTEGPDGTSENLSIQQANFWTGLAADHNWNTAGNWSCGVVPLPTDHVEVVETTATYPIITAGTAVAIYSLTLKADAQLKVDSGSTLVVTDAVNINTTASMVIEDEASLVQVNNVVNTGAIVVKKITSPMKKFDFTYWSSPVAGQKIYDLSPNTLADKYFSYNPTTGTWICHLNGLTIMEKGKGYIVRAPQNFSTTLATPYTDGQFVGTPNNGSISTPIVMGASDMNLIGNPYPSAIDIDLFLIDPANAAITDGVIYLWTHNSAPALIPGDATYNYTSNDYAVYNLLGGVATATMGNNEQPTGKIASGQSFFIRGTANGNVVFDNSMRVVFQNNQFFRNRQTLERHRVWMNLSNAEGAFKQTLVGYTAGASNDIDRDFDGLLLNANSFINFYSIVNTKNFSIQGRALPFNEADSIALGFSTTLSGTYTITADHYDGLFEDRNLYLFDYTDNSYHDLKASAFQFTTAVGTFDTRFELRFFNPQLAISTIVKDQNVLLYAENHQVIVKATTLITQVSICDLRGRTIYKKNNPNSLNFTSDQLTLANQVVIVKIILAEGQTVIKKLVL